MSTTRGMCSNDYRSASLMERGQLARIDQPFMRQTDTRHMDTQQSDTRQPNVGDERDV
jgi:hypothetical protein